MNAVQIISYSIYRIIKEDEINEKNVRNALNELNKDEGYFDRNIRKDVDNNWTNYVVDLSLRDWNEIKTLL